MSEVSLYPPLRPPSLQQALPSPACLVATCKDRVLPYPEYSRSYLWSPFPPRRARPGPGPHTTLPLSEWEVGYRGTSLIRNRLSRTGGGRGDGIFRDISRDRRLAGARRRDAWRGSGVSMPTPRVDALILASI